MPGRTTVAALCGLGAGITLTIATVEAYRPDHVGSVLLFTAARLLPMIGVTVVGLAVLRRWLDAHEWRTEQRLTSAAQLRQQYTAEYTRRLRILEAREAQLNRSAEAARGQLSSLAQRLDEALAARAQEQRKVLQLQEEYDLLARDWNQLVVETYRDRYALFNRGSSSRSSTEAPRGTAAKPTWLRTKLPQPHQHNEHSRAMHGGDAG